MAKVTLPKWCSLVRSNPAAYERDVFSLPILNSPSLAAQFVRPTLQHQEIEVFLVVSLDAQNRPLGITKVSSGTVHSSLVYPRETFRAAIVLGASSIFVAHNHPSGDPSPSMADREVTAQIVAAGMILDIPVFDHIIIGGDRWTSFAQSDLL